MYNHTMYHVYSTQLQPKRMTVCVDCLKLVKIAIAKANGMQLNLCDSTFSLEDMKILTDDKKLIMKGFDPPHSGKCHKCGNIVTKTYTPPPAPKVEGDSDDNGQG